MISVIIVTGQFVLLPRCYYKVGEGEALILNKMSRMLVKFDGGLAIPVFEKAHVVRITVQRIPCDCEVRSSVDAQGSGLGSREPHPGRHPACLENLRCRNE